jgi:hypothetical protein
MFNQPIESWKLSRVTNISQILKKCNSLSGIYSYYLNYLESESRKERLKKFFVIL